MRYACLMIPLTGIVALGLSGAATAQCRRSTGPSDPGFLCPNSPGLVVVDAAFDGSGTMPPQTPHVLGSEEIQCAIDCLDGNPGSSSQLYLGAASIPGGEVRFVAGIPYAIDRPLKLPANVAQSLRVVGYGAVLNLVPTAAPPTVFARVLNDSSDSDEAERVSSKGWVFEGLTFVVTGPLQPERPTKAIELHALLKPVIRNCTFKRFYRAIETHFVQWAEIAGNEFIDTVDRGVFLGDRSDCLDPSCSSPPDCNTQCWVYHPRVLETGSLGPRLQGNHHSSSASTLGSVRPRAAVWMNNLDNALVMGDVYEGVRPEQTLYLRRGGYRSTYMLRSLRFAYAGPPEAGDRGLIRLNSTGMLAADGLTVTPGHRGEKLIAVEPRESTIIRLTGVDLPEGVVFENPHRPGNDWRFDDVEEYAQPVTSSERWATSVPEHIQVSDRDLVREQVWVEALKGYPGPEPDGAPGPVQVTASQFLPTRVEVRGDLVVPIAPPAPNQHGALGFDPAAEALYFCCDGAGRPVYLLP